MYITDRPSMCYWPVDSTMAAGVICIPGWAGGPYYDLQQPDTPEPHNKPNIKLNMCSAMETTVGSPCTVWPKPRSEREACAELTGHVVGFSVYCIVLLINPFDFITPGPTLKQTVQSSSLLFQGVELHICSSSFRTRSHDFRIFQNFRLI